MPLPARMRRRYSPSVFAIRPPPTLYDRQANAERPKQVMEHEDTATTKEAVRGVGADPMRDMQEHVWSKFRPSVQEANDNDDRGTGNGCPVVSEVPRDGGTQRPRTDVRDDNRDHYTPTKFGIKLCQMWIDALKTDDEQWYLDGYDLYIDRVIFNPNI